MIIIVISSYYLIKDFLEYKASNNSNNELIEDVFIEENIEKDDNKKEIIDWKKLKEINEDIIGWISIKDTKINYPILKDDNLYYLKHTYDKRYNNNGSIFTINRQPFEEQETIIYGHNMKNGIMFSELGKYLDKEFFYSHTNFEIYTLEHNYKATVFSSYSIDVNEEENNIKKLDFNEEIEYYKNSSKYSNKDIGDIEKIIKLSTCSYLNATTTPTNNRYFIIAKIEIIS